MAETLVTASQLRSVDGRLIPIDVRRWIGPTDAVDESLLDRALGPVLDVGCGPGRHVEALHLRGVEVLGVDLSPTAVALARRRGARVLQRSIFESLPHTGDWGSALLLDGSIGIGGDPAALLARLAELLHGRGRVLLEAESPEVESEALTVRIETRNGASPWFPWARLSVCDVDDAALSAGFVMRETWEEGGRYFTRLERDPDRSMSAGVATPGP
jgi:SAM-dependent methyltransferase